MGKSLKNSVSPEEICDDYGADTLRVYEMAMGPLDTSRPWATKDVVGAQRFLQRLWRLVIDENTGNLVVVDDAVLTDDDNKALHRTVAGVREDYAELGSGQTHRVRELPDQGIPGWRTSLGG